MTSYFRCDAKLPLKVLLIIEVLWIFLYGCFVFWFELGSDGATDIVLLRDALIKSAFHATSAFSIASALEKPLGHAPLAPLFFVVMALFTDLFSVFEAFLHLAGAAATQLMALKAINVMAVVLSGLSLVFYAILIGLQWTSHRDGKKLRKYTELDARISH